MHKTTCPHCAAPNHHLSQPPHFTVAICEACSRQYLRRPAGKVLAVLQTRIDGMPRRYEIAGILAGAPSAI